MKVATPNHVAAVSGTGFTITVFDGYDTVNVLEGCVHIKPHQGKAEKKLCAGEKANVYRSGTID
jgi:ferric-dicitrate binding protein FerR (iron transport regulator)